LMSEDKSKVKWNSIAKYVFYQFIFAIFVTKISFVFDAFLFINKGLDAIANSASEGMKFCFGSLSDPAGPAGFILGLHAFPVIIIISAISGILMHFRILPFIAKSFSLLFHKLFGVGGVVGLGTSLNMFFGLESIIFMKSYLNRLSRNELFTLMTCGAAGIACSMVPIYKNLLSGVIPNPVVHILSSIVVVMPSVFAISAIIVPEASNAVLTDGKIIDEKKDATLISVIYDGLADGGKIVINLILVLVGFVALIHLCNVILGHIIVMGMPLSVEKIFGTLASPIAWLIGVPWTEAEPAGMVLATKFIFNEIVGYESLAKVADALSERSRIILTYAGCGFANISTIGIIMAIYKSLAPNRSREIIQLAMKAILAGAICNYMSGSIMSVVYNSI
ncbi:MAG: hypothetical protein O3C05_00910, partial [Proteobacteria bacterium]|nr:hypothetical protein [Pseudomonadota bacterium]